MSKISIQNLCKSFGKQQVLKGVNLEIAPDKITVIIGQSGEGKSVLLKTLIGLIDPDSGKILIEGVDREGLDRQERNELTKKFGFLFQGAALFDSMNVAQNVAFPLKEHTNLKDSEIREKVQGWLESLGLPDIGKKLPSELSGGMRKRVGLARALILEPEIMLYDEPTTGLDPMLTDAVHRLIVDTQKKFGITSVIVSHDLQAAFDIADQVVLLHEGVVLEEGTPEEMKQSTKEFVKKFLAGESDPDFIG